MSCRMAGATYPLNSKKIVVNQLRTLAAMLELPSEGTCLMTQQVRNLLFGVDCRTSTDAEFLNPITLQLTDVQDYREKLSLSLASAS